MEFGVWFVDEMGHILQSIATTGDDVVAAAGLEGDPQLLRAYQAGFHAALRSVAQALNIPPPKTRAAGSLRLVARPRIRPRPARPGSEPAA